MFELLMVPPNKVGPQPTRFLGEVAQTDFITFSQLITECGVTGTSINPDDKWIHFVTTLGKDLYFPKKAIRKGVYWNQLNTQGVVTGTKTVTISGKVYRVRLFLMSSGQNYLTGKEWNEYIVNLTNGKYAAYDLFELGTGINSNVNGAFNLGQEDHPTSTAQAPMKVCAAYRNINEMWSSNPAAPDDGNGWRPILEAV